MLEMRCWISGAVMICFISEFNRSMIGFGVPARATSICHATTSKIAGADSFSERRDKRERGQTLRGRHRERAQLAISDERQRSPGLDKGAVDVARGYVDDPLRTVPVGNMGQLQAEPLFHQFDCKLRHSGTPRGRAVA